MKHIYKIQSCGISVSKIVTSQCANKMFGDPTPSCFIYKQVNAQPYLKQLLVWSSVPITGFHYKVRATSHALGAQKLTGQNPNIVLAKFSTLS
jgi:hypothetical protein